MGASEGDAEPAGGEVERAPPGDLIDFYRRWPEFRETAVVLGQRSDLSLAERETLKWLILLVDRIGEHDIVPLNRA